LTKLLLALGVLGLAGWLAWRRRQPAPFPPWLTPLLAAPWRRRYFSPQQAADRHGVRAGLRVLEIGPGAGYLTGAVADRLGPVGRLVCLDVQHAMLRKLRRALAPRAVCSVAASGSQLPFVNEAFDLVYLAHVLGEIPDRSGALRECARVIGPDGVVAVTEGLPDPDFISHARLLRMASGVGLIPTEHFGGRWHYTQRFAKRSAARSRAR
jgi:ubiquinone/menaquinone biosynthesis C-methylase UbiE